MNDAQPSPSGFLLTRQWRDRADGLELVFWISTADGPVRAVIHGQEAVCFVPRNTDLDPWIRNFSIERRPLDSGNNAIFRTGAAYCVPAASSFMNPTSNRATAISWSASSPALAA
jgi:hypothetical protein